MFDKLITRRLSKLRNKLAKPRESQKVLPMNSVEQTSAAANLPVELLLYIFTFREQRIPGPLPDDQEGASELYEVTWGRLGYDKQLLPNAARVCRAWNHVASDLLYDVIFITSSVSIQPLLRTLNSNTWKDKGLQVSDIVFHPRFMDNYPDSTENPGFSTEDNTTTQEMVSAVASSPTTTRIHLHTLGYYFPQSHQALPDLKNLASLHLKNPGSLPLLALRDRHPLIIMWSDLEHVLHLQNLTTLSLHGVYVREKEFTAANFPSLIRFKMTECWFPPDFTVERSGWSADAERIDLHLSYLYMRGISDSWKFIQNILRSSADTLENLALAEVELRYPLQLDVDHDEHVILSDNYVPSEVQEQLSALPRLRKLFLTTMFFLSSLPVMHIPLLVEEFSVYSLRREIGPHPSPQTWLVQDIINNLLDRGESHWNFGLKNIHVVDTCIDWDEDAMRDVIARCAKFGVNIEVKPRVQKK